MFHIQNWFNDWKYWQHKPYFIYVTSNIHCLWTKIRFNMKIGFFFVGKLYTLSEICLVERTKILLEEKNDKIKVWHWLRRIQISNPRCFTMPVSWGEGIELVVDTIRIVNEFDFKHERGITFFIILKTRRVAPRKSEWIVEFYDLRCYNNVCVLCAMPRVHGKILDKVVISHVVQ